MVVSFHTNIDTDYSRMENSSLTIVNDVWPMKTHSNSNIRC